MKESRLRGVFNRILQHLARFGPGATGFRVLCHRMRGVRIDQPAWIGYDTIIETSRPELVSIGRNSELMARVMIIAHMEGATGVEIGKDVYVGPGSIILPNVKIGDGSVITAGSVVNRRVPPKTMMQGNPARPIAKCDVPLVGDIPVGEFQRNLRSLRKKKPRPSESS